MVQGPAGPHRIQVCGALPAPDGELPSDNTRVRQKDPDLVKPCAVLTSVKTAARRFAVAFG